MPEKAIKEKVLVYVIRDQRLLVFRHTDYSYEEVGIQVPAGSVRAGETPEDAALREAREETGLHDFTIVRKLGETDYDISPYRFEIQHRHVFHLELTEPTPQRWMSQENHDGQQQPTHFECFWIPLEAAHILQSGQGALLGRLYTRPHPAKGNTGRPTQRPGPFRRPPADLAAAAPGVAGRARGAVRRRQWGGGPFNPSRAAHAYGSTGILPDV